MFKYILFVLLIGISGCKKFVEIPPSPLTVESSILFKDGEAATAAVTGLYAQAIAGNLVLLNAGVTLYSGLSSDELYNTAANTNADQFQKNKILPTSSIVNTNLWSHAYRFIYHSNAILEGLALSKQLPAALRDELTGEMKFVRAFYYFYLVNLFGDVPLVVSTDYAVNATMARTPSTQIYDQIIADLRDAKMKMRDSYASAGKVRPNTFTASALLARVYLYLQRWADAEAEASTVIASNNYKLLTDLNAVFLNNSDETIWQVVRDNNNTADGSTFVPSSSTARPAYALTDTILKSFNGGDKRFANWVRTNVASSVSYRYPYKYKQRTTTPATESEVIFRYAEQFLIRSEASAMQDKTDIAIDDLNAIRVRAGLAALGYTFTKQQVLDSCEKERKAELFAEWGHRWLDLKRWNKADAHLKGIKPTWQVTAQLYPIPFTEIQRNPFLTPNPGY